MAVSVKLLKEYGFEKIHNYFDYVIESVINGQMKQVEDLIIKMSKAQKIAAMLYFKSYECPFEVKYCRVALSKTIDNL